MLIPDIIHSQKKESGIYKRNFKIDLLRGFSIIFVILLHLNIRVAFNGTALGEMIPRQIYNLLFWSGIYGVEIFFTISGFLITLTALRRYGAPGNVRPADFYKNRAARIAPLLLLLLAVLSLLDIMEVENYVVDNSSGATLGKALLAALTFSVNWLEMKIGYLPGAWDVLWSLSVEEVFYIAFPLVCLICKRYKTLFIFMLVMFLISPLFRNFWFTANEFGERNNFACMGAMAAGCMGGITACSGRNKRIKGLSFIAGMGKHSYEIYLSHMFIVLGGVSIFESFNNSNDSNIYILYASVIILACIAGKLIARFYTDPLNNCIRNIQFRKNIKA